MYMSYQEQPMLIADFLCNILSLQQSRNACRRAEQYCENIFLDQRHFKILRAKHTVAIKNSYSNILNELLNIKNTSVKLYERCTRLFRKRWLPDAHTSKTREEKLLTPPSDYTFCCGLLISVLLHTYEQEFLDSDEQTPHELEK